MIRFDIKRFCAIPLAMIPGLAIGVGIPSLVSVATKTVMHEFTGAVIASLAMLSLAVLLVTRCKTGNVFRDFLLAGVMFGALFSSFFWGAMWSKFRDFSVKQQMRQQSVAPLPRDPPTGHSEGGH